MVWLYSMPFGVSARKLKVWSLDSLEDSFTYGGSWWLLAEDFSSSLCAFSWSLSLVLEWAFTQSEGWDARKGIWRETCSSCTFSWPGPRSHVASLSSSICWNCHKTPGFKGWWNRLYLWTRSWKSMWDQKWSKGHCCKIHSQESFAMMAKDVIPLFLWMGTGRWAPPQKKKLKSAWKKINLR